MRDGRFASAAGFALTVGLVGSAVVTVNGQARTASPKASQPASAAKPATPHEIPRTLDGKPDFSGIWSAFIVTPIERPVGAPEFITGEEQRARLEQDQQEKISLRIYGTVTPPGGKTTDAHNTLWKDGYWERWDMIATLPRYRTSQVIDPPDGRLPATTERVQPMIRERVMRQNRPPEGPEDRPIWTRCVRGQVSGPPLVGTEGSYNNDIHIVQGPDAVAVVQEMNHETQIVPLDGRPRTIPAAVKLVKGDSRGYWEGDTLVIDTTNYIGATMFNAGPMIGGGMTSEQLHVVERYRLLDQNNMLYQARVEDAQTWVKPFTLEFVMWRMPDQKQLVEYACHEGNRSLGIALAGARALEARGIKDPVYFAPEGRAAEGEEEAVK
jgi:hypothetical protein